MDALNIMVVDDSSLSTKRLTQILGMLGHKVVQTARTGADAVALYPNVLPDLVTMDVAMPDMDGIEALRRILTAYPDALIIMVTSHEMDMKVVEAVNAGAKGYVRKPADKDEVERVIERVVSTVPYTRPNTRLCALMMGDVVHSSRIVTDTLKTQLHTVLHGRIGSLRARYQIMFDQFTGDGFFLCGNDITEIAEAALDFVDYFQSLNWRQIGFDEPMAIRIALDLNKVSVTVKDGQLVDVAGVGIDHVARIEPVVTPNQVWCTQHFFQQLEREGQGRIAGVALGLKELAKDAGSEELVRLVWQTHDK
jgi:two-component system chemotaxis response regulator CheY